MINCREVTRQRKRGLGFWGEDTFWDTIQVGNLCGKSLWWLRGVLFLEWGRERDTFTNGNLCPYFRQIGGQKFPLASTVSQLPLAQRNSDAEVAYFKIAYSDPFLHHSTPYNIQWMTFTSKMYRCIYIWYNDTSHEWTHVFGKNKSCREIRQMML